MTVVRVPPVGYLAVGGVPARRRLLAAAARCGDDGEYRDERGDP